MSIEDPNEDKEGQTVEESDSDDSLDPRMRRWKWIAASSIVLVAGLVVVLWLVVLQGEDDNKTTNAAPLDEIERYRSFRSQAMGISGATRLIDPDSPQSRALQFTLTNPTVSDHFAQRYALAVLYYACGGSNFREVRLDDDIHECELVGVICNEQLQIIELHWDYSKVTGQLPNEIGAIATLEILDLNDNDISGTLPTTLAKLAQLKRLFVAYNALTGSLPEELSQLTKLQELSIDRTRFQGAFPPSYANLTDMRVLTASSTTVSGDIFAIVESWPKIQKLYLYKTLLGGPIPEDLGRFTNLEQFQLDGDNFAGTLPDSLVELTNLRRLTVRSKNVTGSFPSEIHRLSNLGTFHRNASIVCDFVTHSHVAVEIGFLGEGFDGVLPTTIGHLTDLQYLILLSTSITGTLPSEIGYLTKLESLQVVRAFSDRYCP